MPRIPVYEQRTTPTGLAQSRASGVQVASLGPALQNMGQALGNISTDIFRKQEQEREDDAAIAASTALSEGRLYWGKRLTELSDGWTPDAPGAYDTFSKEYKDWSRKIIESGGTDKAKNYLRERLAAMQSDYGLNAYKVDREKRIGLNVSRWEDGATKDADVVFSDPSKREVVIGERIAALEALTGIDPGKKIEIGRRFKETIDYSAEQGSRAREGNRTYLAGRVRAVVDGAAGAPAPAAGGGFDSVIGQILKHEGGYTPSDGNSGAPANFGINQRANPDIDVKNLTKEGAVKLYRDRYWNAINGDSLPAALQGTAMDAAVNQGPALARRWIQESGGDPAKFNALRREHYEMLLQDSKFARFRKAWMGRLEYYENQPASGGAAAPLTIGETRFEFLPEDQLPASFRGLPIEKRMALLREAEQEARQQDASASLALQQRLRDAAAMAKDGIPDPQPLAPDAFAVLGDKAPTAMREYQRAQVMARDIASMKNASNADLEAVASGSVRRAVAGPGYEAEDAADETRAAAAEATLKARAADPAGYVTKSVPLVTRAVQASLDPNLPPEQRAAAVQNAARETIAAQQVLGIRDPRVLSQSAVTDLGRRISQATRPEDAANLVKALEYEYGKDLYFEQVMDELMRANKLPPALMIIADLPDPVARERVSALSVAKMDDLKAGINPADVKAIADASVDEVGKLGATMPPMSGNSYALLGSYQDMIQRIALDRLRNGQASSAGDAVKAATQMLLGHYYFEDNLRIPTMVKDVPVNPDRVTSVLNRKLSGDALERIALADVPGDATQSRTPQGKLDEWRDTVRTRGVWISDRKNESAQLWAVGKNGTLYRVMSGKNQIAFTFEELNTLPPAPPVGAERPKPDTTGRIQRGPVTPADLDAVLATGDMRTYERLKAQQKAEQRERERNGNR